MAALSRRAPNEVTVADLLSHRVGLTRNAFDRDLEANADYGSLVSRRWRTRR